MTRGNSAVSLVIAGLGVILIALGLVVLGADASKALDSGQWHNESLLDLLQSRSVAPYLAEDFAAWLRHPRDLKGLQPPVVFVLDTIPQWLVCVVLGGLIVWKALK
jgi:hypothetical protein